MRSCAMLLVLLAVLGCEPEVKVRDAGMEAGALPADAEARSDAGPCLDADRDGDGLSGVAECALGLDPERADTDGDGLDDGTEVGHPRVCDGPASCPADPCTSDGECGAGRCVGLDPLRADSDGDGVADGVEDPDGDAVIRIDVGETDPRRGDTDCDGLTDALETVGICRGEERRDPVLHALPESGLRLAAHPDLVASPAERGLALDAPALELAGAVLVLPRAADLTEGRARVETALGSVAASVAPWPRPVAVSAGLSMAYRVRVGEAASAFTVRDVIGTALSGAPVAGGGLGSSTSTEHHVQVTLLADDSRTIALVAVAPSSVVDDLALSTSERMEALTDATGLGAAARLADGCRVAFAETYAPVELLWMVDTTTSTAVSEGRQIAGDIAPALIEALRVRGLDARIGVFEAAHSDIDLDEGDFRFIDAGAEDAARQLQFQVTREAYRGDPADHLAPYDLGSTAEQPVAAAIALIDELERRRDDPNPHRTLRPGARVLTFFLTDAVGRTEDELFFAINAARWGHSAVERVARAASFFRARDIALFAFLRDNGAGCDVMDDLVRCVVTASGGGWTPVGISSPSLASTVVEWAASAASAAQTMFTLPSMPISATLRVHVDGAEVPRSAIDGFDFDARSGEVVLRGDAYRPVIGSEIVIAYRAWPLE